MDMRSDLAVARHTWHGRSRKVIRRKVVRGQDVTLLEQIADSVSKQIERKVMFMTLPQREEIRKIMVREFLSVCVEQGKFHFTGADAARNEAQNLAILKLLKERRSSGVTNVELAQLALKYTSRLSQLRQPPYNYRISCTREEGRLTRYRLTPEDW
jgi:hypothetical protein